MPRLARVKTVESIFHVMSRSITEVDLFKDDEDKLKYLELTKKYQQLYLFRVYGYCLMDTHVHMIIDANGADISSIMKSINLSYAIYFNQRHKRHGHLFQDRFRSKIIDNDKYLMVCSAYIHNNPTELAGFKQNPEEFKFSSLTLYLKKHQDPYELVDDGFIKKLFGKNPSSASERYRQFLCTCNDLEMKKNMEFDDVGTLYTSGRVILYRNVQIDEITTFVTTRTGLPGHSISVKWSRNAKQAKALVILLMRSMCNFSCVDICNTLGNITQSRVSSLSSLGIKLALTDRIYMQLVKEFIDSHHNYNQLPI